MTEVTARQPDHVPGGSLRASPTVASWTGCPPDFPADHRHDPIGVRSERAEIERDGRILPHSPSD
jgi:hypothetical protein